MVYFIGNVLTSHADADKHPERAKEHFHITPEEAAGMDVTGLPVHLEHANNVKVGAVERQWNDASGEKWVLANVDTTTIEGKFVRNDLSSAQPVYGSLSLQHMYRKYASGRSSKEPLEVSICKDPRRPGCNIVYSSSATAPAGYKVSCHAERHMASTTNDKIATEAVPETNPAGATANATASATPSTTQLMAEVVEASRQNEDLQKQLKEKDAKLAAHAAAKEAEALQAKQQQTQVAQELGDAVLEHVAKLDPALANEDTTKAIDMLREKYPQEIARVLEVACCASKRASELEDQLKTNKMENERKLMEQAYHAAVATRSGCYGTPLAPEAVTQPDAQSVRASKRQCVEEPSNPFAVHRAPTEGGPASAPTQTLLQIQEAYNSLKGSGSTTDAMKNVAGIIRQQRERGFR